MQMNNGEANNLHLHYSPTAKTSLGYKFEYWRDGDYTINAVQMNNLLKRWNAEDSQANLYLKSGAGIAHSNEETSPAFFYRFGNRLGKQTLFHILREQVHRSR